MSDLPARFSAHFATLALPPGPAGIAVSGGPDSLALLDLLAREVSGFPWTVLHVDHGIDPMSAQVAEMVENRARSYGLPVFVGRLHLDPRASETEARRARYRWLTEQCRARGLEWLFLGHQRDDQVETILMRALNGSGPAGLAGMPARHGRLVRPLLPFGREELVAYLVHRGVSFHTDPANRDSRHLRSWLRTAVIPALRERLPVEENLLRLGRQASENRRAWDELLRGWVELGFRQEVDAVSVAVASLRGYDSSLARGVIQALARAAGMTVGPRAAERVRRLISGPSGRFVELGERGVAEVAFGRLRLFRQVAHPLAEPVQLSESRGTARFGRWRVEWSPEVSPERIERSGWTSWFDPGLYLVRPWHPGDKVAPLRGAGRRLVVRCMQDARIPESRRSEWPVVEAAGRVVWVPGVCRGSEAVPNGGAPALRIDVRPA